MREGYCGGIIAASVNAASGVGVPIIRSHADMREGLIGGIAVPTHTRHARRILIFIEQGLISGGNSLYTSLV